jgi:hypothetical protein
MQDGLVVENRLRIINPFKGLQQASAESGGSSAYSGLLHRKPPVLRDAHLVLPIVVVGPVAERHRFLGENQWLSRFTCR